MKKLFSILLLSGALSACGGSGGSDSSTVSSSLDDVAPIESSQAALSIDNAQDFVSIALPDHDLREEARKALFNSQAYYARNTLTETTQCSGGGEISMQLTEGTASATVTTTFNACTEDSVTMNGAIYVKVTTDGNESITKMESSYRNYQIEGQDVFTGEAFSLQIQGGYLFSRQGEHHFTELANMTTTNRMTGQSIALENVQLTFDLDVSEVLPQQAQGKIVSSEHGNVQLSQVAEALILTGDNSRLEITEAKDSFGFSNGIHFSLDTDNDGNIDNMGEAYSLDDDINWVY